MGTLSADRADWRSRSDAGPAPPCWPLTWMPIVRSRSPKAEWKPDHSQSTGNPRRLSVSGSALSQTASLALPSLRNCKWRTDPPRSLQPLWPGESWIESLEVRRSAALGRKESFARSGRMSAASQRHARSGRHCDPHSRPLGSTSALPEVTAREWRQCLEPCYTLPRTKGGTVNTVSSGGETEVANS